MQLRNYGFLIAFWTYQVESDKKNKPAFLLIGGL